MRSPLRTLCALAACAAALGAGSAHAQLAKGHARFLGNVYATSQLPGFALYWNQVTPENAGKWGSAEPQRDQMNWAELDAMMELARSNGFPVHFHVLVWGNQQPSWIESLPPSEQLVEIEEWFSAIATRYPDLDWVEVVNEPLHDPPNQAGGGGGNYYEALGGAGTSGWDWVLNAFRLARAHFPGAGLMINDFNIVGSATNTARYLALIELLKAENLLDVIGVQGHAFSTVGASVEAMRSNLDLLAATGLGIQVTELDIDGTSAFRQGQEYERVFPVLWEHPGVEGITLWGWRDGMWRTAQGATLMTSSGTEKYAMTWLRSYLDHLLAGIDGEADVPAAYVLEPAYPNPFNPSTTLPFALPRPARVTLRVVDTLGRTVDILRPGFLPAGRHEVTWNAAGLPSGSYVVRLEAEGTAAARTLTLLR